MRKNDPRGFSKDDAAKALATLLGQVSVIKLKHIRSDVPDAVGNVDILAQISVLGRSQTLVCKVVESGEPRPVRAALRKLHDHTAKLAEDATPVIIAPNLSEQAQALCMETGSGFVDLEGNARLFVDEVFIALRSLPHRDACPSSAVGRLETKRFEIVAA
jgi:hypothetical protein